MLPDFLRRIFGKSKHMPDSSEIRSALSTGGPEKRSVPFKSMDVRSRQDGRPVIHGYAHVYETQADIRWFTETFKRGAFSRSIGKVPHFSLWDHDTGQVLGATDNDTLMVRSDDLGIYFEATPPDPEEAPYVKNALAQLRGGYVKRGSIRFEIETEDDEVWEMRNGVLHRDISQAILIEASPTPIPAYKDTMIGLRSFDMVSQYLGEDIESLRQADVDLMDMDIFLMEVGGMR